MSSAKVSASCPDATRRLRAQGTPAASNAAFILALSRKFSATSGPIPAMPRRRRTSPSWTWRFSRMPSRQSTPPTRWPTSATAPVRESTSRQSSSCQCPATGVSPNRSMGSLLTAKTRASGTSATARTKRTVAAIAYGATNTMFMAFPGHAGRCWPLARWRSLARIGAGTSTWNVPRSATPGLRQPSD